MNQDIFSHFEELPLPDYLESARDQQFSEMLNSARGSMNQQSNANMLWSLVCCFRQSEEKYYQNRHEKLLGRFKFSKEITFVTLQALQLCLSICAAWLIMFIVSGMITTSSIISDVSRRPQVYLLCLVILVQSAFFAISSVISMSGMPATVRTYTLTSSIEMLKNREVIEQVLLSQKSEKNARAYRVFQAMRLMRREYMKMVSIGDFNLNMSSSDTCSDYGSEEGTTRHQHSMSVASEIQMPEQLG